MRRSDWLVGIVALLGGGLAANVGACVFSADFVDDCESYPHQGCPGVGTTTSSGTGGTGTGGTGTGGTGTGGTTTTPPIDCSGDPQPVVGNVGNIREECAVFVKSGATSGDGSMASPVGSIAEAIAKTTVNRPKVFVCTPANTPLQEAVNVAAPNVELFGGFDCSNPDWTWTEAGRSEVEGPADKVAWTVTDKANNALVSGFKIKAASPTNPTGGGHSIGMQLADVTVSVQRCDVEASDAADGNSPDTLTDPVQKGADAPPVVHAQMDACINQLSLIAGPEGQTNCGGTDTNGGKGGKGGEPNVNSGDGSDGSSGMPSATTGLGGTGQTTTGNPPMSCTGGTGGSGDPGSNGSAGTALGMLSPAGLTGGDGGNGGPGMPGQGGGGGGGAKAGSFCAGGVDGVGASGGGGGAGGCGGKGGPGGQAGGSSIAIISLGNKPLIDGMTVTLKSGKGGKGGKGAAGQAGGTGGAGANGGASSGISPSKPGCDGGKGGPGGDGGPGGGGRGGHSIGIVFAKAPPANLTFMMTPVVGMPGGGGMSGGNTGANGQAGAVCDFSKAANPCM